MRAALFAMVVPFLFCGCSAGGCLRSPAPEKPEIDPVLAAEIKLPEIAGAQPLDKSVEYKIFLLVNDQGNVLLAPEDRYRDSGGSEISTLDNGRQVLVFLKRRAKEDRDAMGPANKDKPLRSTIILRVHKDCPFEKTYAIMKAGPLCGYTEYRWRVSRGAEGEGEIAVTVPVSQGSGPRHEPDAEFTVRATATGAGKLAKITLRGTGIEGDLDLKTDVDALTKHLTNLAAKNKGKRVELNFEIGPKLLQSDVIKLIGAAVGAGFTDVWPFLIDESKR